MENGAGHGCSGEYTRGNGSTSVMEISVFGFNKEAERYSGQVIITSTPMIEGAQVTRYFGMIMASVVQGTGPVAEWFNKATDMFGGRSGSFETKIDAGIEMGMQQLEVKARARAPEHGERLAVVGVDIDVMAFERNQVALILSGTVVAYVPAASDTVAAPVQRPAPTDVSAGMMPSTPGVPVTEMPQDVDPRAAALVEETLQKVPPAPDLRPLSDGMGETLAFDPDGATGMVDPSEVASVTIAAQQAARASAPLSNRASAPSSKQDPKSRGRGGDSQASGKRRWRKRKKKPPVDPVREDPSISLGGTATKTNTAPAAQAQTAVGVTSSGGTRRSMRTPDELLEAAARANGIGTGDKRKAEKMLRRQASHKKRPKYGGVAGGAGADQPALKTKADASAAEPKKKTRQKSAEEELIKVDTAHAPVGVSVSGRSDGASSRPQTDLDAPI